MNEKEQLERLTRLQKRYLSKRCCGLCNYPLHRRGCGGLYLETREDCTEDVRMKRREECLKKYHPKKKAK